MYRTLKKGLLRAATTQKELIHLANCLGYITLPYMLQKIVKSVIGTMKTIIKTTNWLAWNITLGSSR